MAQVLAERCWRIIGVNFRDHDLFLFSSLSAGSESAFPSDLSRLVDTIMSRSFPVVSVFRPVWRRNFSASTSKRAIDKRASSAADAIKNMKGPATVLVGGFGFSGVPNTLINAVRDRPDITDLTVVSNNAGMPGAGLGRSLNISNCTAIGAILLLTGVCANADIPP
jgi:hypothetical protein